MLEQPTLTHSPESPDDKLKRLRERVVEQTGLIEHLRQHIRELETRLAKDSHNSSRPPSSDSPFKKPPPARRRQSTRFAAHSSPRQWPMPTKPAGA